MSHRHRPSQTSVSLFPFLAVLLCTMGALIVLLVGIAREAQVQAAAANTAAPEKETDASKQLARRIASLKETREKAARQLEQSNGRLAFSETHTRELRDRLAGLVAAIREVERQSQDGGVTLENLDAELARIQQLIVDAEATLRDLTAEAKRRRPTYSIIPHHGPNQTRRRPIYVECRENEIVLQPEGVVMTHDDFLGPNTPGNALASALRATREHFTSTGQVGQTAYPLLLVRPDGVASYYIARQAVESLDSGVGYELIEQDWDVKFPMSDPTLAAAQQRAVEEARILQQTLIATSRSSENAGSRRYVVSSSRGGVEPVDLRGGGNSTHPGRHRPSRASATSGVRATGTGGNGSGGGPWAGQNNGNLSGGGDRSGNRDRGGANRDGRSPAHSGGPNVDAAAAGPNAQRPASEGTEGNRSGGARSGPGGTGTGPEATGEGTPGSSPGSATRLAESRGRNWGLPDATETSVPVTRPISIRCYSDRLVIMPDDALRTPRVILLGRRTADSIDPFVTAVWQHMKGWGIGGKGMYWRPLLSFHVRPGGEKRYEEVEQLLDDSGLRVRRAK